MLSKESFINDLKEARLKKTDTVLIHSSMKKIGQCDANIVVDALMEYFKEGLLIMPTHTWGSIKNDDDLFDVKNSVGNVGIIPEIFRKREGVARSLHPTHSVAAYGKGALEYIKGEENKKTPCDPNGVYGRLYERKAKILLIGVNHIKNTYIHSVEESFDVQNRIANKLSRYKVLDTNNKIKEVELYRHYCSLHPHVSECYQKLEPLFSKHNAQYHAKFGNADMIVCDAVKIYKILECLLKEEKQLLVEYNEIPEKLLSKVNLEK